MIGLNSGLQQNGNGLGNGQISGTTFTAQQDELVDMIHAMIGHAWGQVGPRTVKAAIYDWATGQLLSSTVELSYPEGNSVPKWETFMLNTPVSIVAGKQYYLCLVAGGADFAIEWMNAPGANGFSHWWGITLNANKDLTDQPPTVLNSSTIFPIGPLVGEPTRCDSSPFGVCSYDGYRQYGIYADKSGTPMQVSVVPATATAQINQNQIFSLQILGGTPPYSVVWTANGTQIGTGETVTVNFATAGTYVIAAQVTDALLQLANAEAVFTVMGLPSPQPPFPMPVLPDFPVIPSPILPPATFDYIMDLNGSNYTITESSTNTVIFTNADPQVTLQQLILLTASNQRIGIVKSIGLLNMNNATDGVRQCSLKFQDYAKIYVENGNNLTNTNSTVIHVLKFDGRQDISGVTLRNGAIVEGLNGRAKITGNGTVLGAESGAFVRQVNHMQLRHLELTYFGGGVIGLDGDGNGAGAPAYNDDNYFEDLIITKGFVPATDVTQGSGWFAIDGNRNVLRNILVDGESRPGARAGIVEWAGYATDTYNLFEDIEVRNIIRDGIYFTSDAYATSLNYLRRIKIINAAQGNSYSAFKYRPAYYCYVEDLTIEGGYAGITLGTAMAFTPHDDDGLGGPHNGWSRGNRYVRVKVNGCRVAGLNMDIDQDGLGVEQNTVDAILTNCNLGLWFNNGEYGSSLNGINRDNTFFVTLENCQKAIHMSANINNNALTYRNRIIGIVRNCIVAANITNSGVMDNYFDLVIIGGGTINDLGTRNRWNGVGQYAYGIGNTPLASDWNDGDIVINTSDNSAWIKTGGAIIALSAGQTITQFTYMDGKGGLPAQTVQFIDKSFVAGGAVSSWFWDFGDGTTSIERHPQHVYATGGEKSVSLSINGQPSITAIVPVSVAQTTIIMNVVSGTNGTIQEGVGQVTLQIGQAYAFTAVPDVGYDLNYWELNGVNKGSSNPLQLTATSAMNGQTLVALFTAEPPPIVTVTLAVAGNGTTDIGTGAQTFNVGDIVTITAIPQSGATFQGWKLDGAGYSAENPLVLTVTADLNGKTLTADFTTPIQAGFPIWTLIPVGLVGAWYALKGKKHKRK